MVKLDNQELEFVYQMQTRFQQEYPEWRKGQSFYNALFALYPEIAMEISETDIDPFYEDGLMEECISMIASGKPSPQLN